MARQQFVHSVSSPSIQMRLLKKGPETLEAALGLARQWESAELAQQSLRGEKQVQGSFATSEEQPQQPLLVQGAQSTVEELALQAQQLSQQLSKLQAGREVGENKSSPRRAIVCWNCKKTGHVRCNCPQRSRDGRKDRSVKYTSAVACTLTLQGMVERQPTCMLVDMGSSVTLLHERVWNDIAGGKKLNVSQCPVMGESLSLCGQTKVDLMVGRHVRSHTVFVVQGMTQECLLGTDFLEQYQCVIDVRGRTMTIEGETVSLDRMSGRCMATCHVFVQETTVIPPYHELRLQVQLEDENTNGDYVGLFQPKTEMSTHYGLLFVCYVSPVHNGKAVVQLVNPSSVPATLHSQEKVGQMSPLEELDGVNMVEPALDANPPSRSPKVVGKSVEEPMGDISGL